MMPPPAVGAHAAAGADSAAADAGACLCVVVHDVADATLDACERLLGAIAAVAPLPLTFLAVPRYHHDAPSARLEQWLSARSRQGDELALHGWTHRDDGAARGMFDRLRRTRYTRGEGEFWALDREAAARRLRDGIAWFERNGWPLHGFVAPAWLLGPAGWAALRATPLDYTSTLRHIHLLPDGPRITSQSLVYSTSSAWRRAVVGRLGRAASAASLRSNPVLRLELHPRDADHAPIRRSWQRVLERELGRREPLTVAQLVRAPARLRHAATAAAAGAAQSRLKLTAAVSAPTIAPDDHVARIVQAEDHARDAATSRVNGQISRPQCG